MPIQFQRTDQGDHTKLELRGSLDVLTAPELMPTIDQIVEQKRPRVTVDLSGLDIIDSSGVAVLVKLYKGVRTAGGTLEVTGARDQPLAIFKLLRMDKVFSI